MLAQDTNSLSITYSQFDERLSHGPIDVEISPENIGIDYLHISQSGWIFSLNTWQESAQKNVDNNADIETKAEGYGFSVAYPFSQIDLEFSYAVSQPKVEIFGNPNNFLVEESKTQEYAFSAIYYYQTGQWSLIPSLQVGLQHSDYDLHARTDTSSRTANVDEDGWFWSSRVYVGYEYVLNNNISLNPFVDISWTEFFHGNGSSRERLQMGPTITNLETENAFDDDQSGIFSVGLDIDLAPYTIELSFDKPIEVESLETRYNLRLGVSW